MTGLALSEARNDTGTTILQRPFRPEVRDVCAGGPNLVLQVLHPTAKELATNMETPNSKRQKHNKGEDMISNLPDEIIGSILSLLPTKDAVRTGVLSKSWISKWTFITDLHFEGTGPYVNRVLLHLNSSSIQSFSLDMSEDYEPCHVDQWISAVVSRRVKKLCVNLKKIQQALPSHSLLKYKSLEELVLYAYGCKIDVPTFALFSSLTVLNLTGVMLIGDPSDKSGNVHLDFPVMRSYKTKNCTWLSTVKCVTLEAPLLKVVYILDHWYPPNPNPTIKFCASRLIEFTYSGYPMPDPIMFDLSAAHNIASADIDIGLYKEESLQEIMALSSKILKQFKNVECLMFQKWLRKVMLAKDSLTDLPPFEKLCHLELGKVTCEILLTLLLKTPYLKTLFILDLIQFDQELMNFDPVPDCFLTTLQVVTLWTFDVSEHKLSFAKFVIENAVALKRMSFRTIRKLHGPNLKEVKEKLYSFKKCSSFMSLEFS